MSLDICSVDQVTALANVFLPWYVSLLGPVQCHVEHANWNQEVFTSLAYS